MIFGKKKPKTSSDGNAMGGDMPLPTLEIKQMGIARDVAQGLSIGYVTRKSVTGR